MTPGRRRLLHILDGDFASGYFPDLARFADGERFDVLFTSLQPLASERAALLEVAGVSRYRPLRRGADIGGQDRVRRSADGVVALQRAIGALRPDVVHAHLYEPALLGTIAGLLRGVRARVVGRHHSDLVHRAGSPLHVGLDRLATTLSHAVVANSRFTKEVMVDHEGADPAKVRVVYYGLDTKALRPVPDGEIAILRDALGVPPDRFVVVVPARLDREKGHEHLFAALTELGGGALERMTVLLAGSGPDREHFEREIAARGLTGTVRLLGHRRDINRLYQLADLTVLPSLSEAFGQVLIESLCLGTGVVATRVGGIPEIVEDGRTGLLVEPADAGDLARALRASVEQPDRRGAMAAAGQARVREVFDSRRTARENEAIYDELLARAGRAGAFPLYRQNRGRPPHPKDR
ncbi:MAG: hypothetical protein QOI64_1387 [Solirubrobacteraceae bacterium]|nr:hypothetical protein [Solirubrobacteraceae bacterium]